MIIFKPTLTTFEMSFFEAACEIVKVGSNLKQKTTISKFICDLKFYRLRFYQKIYLIEVIRASFIWQKVRANIILQSAFLYKSVLRSFYVLLQFGFVIFWRM